MKNIEVGSRLFYKYDEDRVFEYVIQNIYICVKEGDNGVEFVPYADVVSAATNRNAQVMPLDLLIRGMKAAQDMKISNIKRE